MPHSIDHSFFKNQISIGSLSFSLASRFLSEETRYAVWKLYAWCRYCDDAVDTRHPTEVRRARLRDLIVSTEACMRGAYEGKIPQMIGFEDIFHRYKIAKYYPRDLLAGMAMDVDHKPYFTENDLILYCYRVAGTVGLMFAHISGISDVKALKHAAHLGIAMQLTNIARDVATDAALERVYLPETWLTAAGLARTDVLKLEHKLVIHRVLTQKLLPLADYYYNSGMAGLRYLPIKDGFAVRAASYVYREIGVKVRTRGKTAIEKRMWIRLHHKLWLLAKAGWDTLRALKQRSNKPYKPTVIETVWRLT